jgi:hypothetical protein
MNEFELKKEVIIVATQIKGKIIGIWQTISGPMQYHVRAYESAGRPFDFWFYAEDLKVA